MITTEEIMPQEVLDRLVEVIEPIEKNRFVKIGEASWVYPEPLSIAEKTIKDEIECIDRVTDHRGTIIGLNFPEQLMLQNRIKERFGIDLRHGSLKENVNAFNSNETEKYRERVLDRYAIYTGELERRGENVRRVTRIIIEKAEVPLEPSQIIIDGNGKPIPPIETPTKEIMQIQYVSKDLGKKLPTKEGHFESFEIVPTDKDLNPEGKISWDGSFFSKDNYAIVKCETCTYLVQGKPPEIRLGFASIPPLNKYDLFAIPLWTNNPKK